MYIQGRDLHTETRYEEKKDYGTNVTRAVQTKPTANAAFGNPLINTLTPAHHPSRLG